MQVQGVRRRGISPLRLVVVLVFLGAVYLLVTAAFTPWGFFLGGRFHLIPVWFGKGTLHTSGGDYQLSLYVYPSSSRAGGSVVGGRATLCTPRGERFRMKLWGGMGKRFQDTSLEGKPIHMQLYTPPLGWRINAPDYRPELDFHGQWTGDGLELDDGGSLSRAFLPDGEIYKGPRGSLPPARQKVQGTFHESSWSGFMAPCRPGM